MADRDDSDRPYQIGYRKPPSHTRFAPGKSGNPKGRPKGSRNFATLLQIELERRVVVTENGRRKEITKREAIVKQLVNGAAAGDHKAMPMLLNEARAYEHEASVNQVQAEVLSHEDTLVVDHIVERLRQSIQSSQPAGTMPAGLAEDP